MGLHRMPLCSLVWLLAAALPAPLMLSVTLETLDTIYNSYFEVRLPVAVNRPFRTQTTNGAVTNTISGTVSGPVQGDYTLPLFVSEWASANSNISDAEQFHMSLINHPHAVILLLPSCAIVEYVT